MEAKTILESMLESGEKVQAYAQIGVYTPCYFISSSDIHYNLEDTLHRLLDEGYEGSMIMTTCQRKSTTN